jgi:hypothetical protein
VLIVHLLPDTTRLPVSPPTIMPGVQTAPMAVTFAVLGDTEPEAASELQRMCERLDLEPVGPPHRVVGRAKWMGRARSRTDTATQRQGTTG